MSKNGLALVILGALLLPVFFAPGQTAAAGGTVLEKIVDSGVIRVGVMSNAAPLSYLDERGRRQGYDIAVAKRIAADLLGEEARIELVLLEPEERIDALADNAADLLLCNLAVSPERAGLVDFAAPYRKTQLGLLSSNFDPITEIAGLSGGKLIVVRGSAAESYFAANYPQLELLLCADDLEAFAALGRRRAAAMAGDNLLLQAWAADKPDFKLSVPAFGPEEMIAPAVKKGEADFQAWLNTEINQLLLDGFLLQAYGQYLAPVYGPQVRPEMVIPGYLPSDAQRPQELPRTNCLLTNCLLTNRSPDGLRPDEMRAW